MHVLDLVQNSLEAGATRVEVEVVEDTAMDCLLLSVEDDGRGMSAETLNEISNPFYTTRTTRRVGLGIPLLLAAAQRCGGELRIESEPGRGTKVTATFQRSHIDRAPLGDMAETLLSVLLRERPVELHYRHRVDGRTFEFDTRAVKAELGGLSFSHPAVVNWLRGYLSEGIAELYEGGADAEGKNDRGTAPD